MKSLQEQLAEIEMLAEKATPGPWMRGRTLFTAQTRKWSREEFEQNNIHESTQIFARFLEEDQGRSRQRIASTAAMFDYDQNANFIAASRTLIPQLVAALKLVIEDRDALILDFYDGKAPNWEFDNRNEALAKILNQKQKDD